MFLSLLYYLEWFENIQLNIRKKVEKKIQINKYPLILREVVLFFVNKIYFTIFNVVHIFQQSVINE
jgi:hypothetical protein